MNIRPYLIQFLLLAAPAAWALENEPNNIASQSESNWAQDRSYTICSSLQAMPVQKKLPVTTESSENQNGHGTDVINKNSDGGSGGDKPLIVPNSD